MAGAAIHVTVYCSYVWMVGRAGAIFAVQVSYLVTCFGVFWAMLILGERFGAKDVKTVVAEIGILQSTVLGKACTAIAQGDASLSFARARLADSRNRVLPSTFESTRVTVR